MIKNTKASITLIFAISKKNIELAKALDAICRQTDKNCNLIFVFNGSGQSERDIFNGFDFSSFNQVDHVIFSENLGDAYAFEYIDNNNLHTKYYYYLDCNIILSPDFIATLNRFVQEHPDAEVISFFGVPNIYFKQPYLNIKTMSDDFCNRPLVFFNNKLISTEYIRKNQIYEPRFKHYPMLYYVNLAKHNPKWYSIGRQICVASSKPSYSFNIMDLFEQCEELSNMMDQKWYKDHFSEIEYLVIIALFGNFTSAIFKKNRSNLFFLAKVLNKINHFIENNFPNWANNEWLHSKNNKNDETYLRYLREFKPKLIHVLRALSSKLFVEGHAKRK